MKGQLNFIFEVNMEPELIQVDCYGVVFCILGHFSIPSNLIEKTGDFASNKNNGKNLTVNYRQKPYHMLKMASI